MVEVLAVGLSDIKVARQGQNLRSSGLGSCVGLVLFDSLRHIAGMAHIMLPDNKITRGKAHPPGKFANTAVPELLKQLLAIGAKKSNLYAKMAGGAEMFRTTTGFTANIGMRNIEAVKAELDAHHFELVSADVGGNFGRSIEFVTETGDLRIHTVSQGDKVI
ncbi:chemotaxis protein CheD [Pullulanibacillus pueri]|uniref:Probable chemoreceptor glutamine deamidase CheD n=1 Tax=Pullulanibacillus pueri TaxID=1437324 RepID=A0A8J2ZWN4_9BACL|nr:chemotaxis protein CheD [Pullulanibacillus pueri]MBM7682501.1 chemotaxis protein CheD [Pullulanibacillus pueri]GGH82146.1 chemoreceptor glutamine deamidase CheD [Pullulanibacillus pueri]